MLMTTLEGDYLNRWETFNVCQPLGKVRVFGKDLISLGKEHNCKIISQYGKDIVDAADFFNMEGMLRLLNRYKGITEDLKKYNYEL